MAEKPKKLKLIKGTKGKEHDQKVMQGKAPFGPPKKEKKNQASSP